MAPDDHRMWRGTSAAEAHGRTIPSAVAAAKVSPMTWSMMTRSVSVLGERPVMHTEQRAERVEWGILLSTLPQWAAMSSMAAPSGCRPHRNDSPTIALARCCADLGRHPPRADEHGVRSLPR